MLEIALHVRKKASVHQDNEHYSNLKINIPKIDNDLFTNFDVGIF